MLKRLLCIASLLWGASAAASSIEDGSALSQYYGFGPVEILKSDPGIHSLTIADFGGDGLNDLAVVNNQRSRIELFIQKSDPNSMSAAESTEHVNELVGFGRFERQEILLTIQPGSLVCGDLNGSGRTDIAVYADPPGLYIFYQDAPGPKARLNWQSPRRLLIRDGLKSRGALACGDINGDKRDDLVLAGAKAVSVVIQEADGTLADPIEYASNYKIFEVRLIDFDGDGRNDLVCVTDDRLCPLSVRFGQANGQLGPVIQYRTEPFTDFELLDTPQLFLSIERVSGRLSGSTLRASTSGDDEDDKYGMLLYPLADTGQNAKRDMVCSDFDGDGRPDVLLSRPGEAKVTLFLNSQTGLAEPEDFPALADVVTIAAADLDGDKRNEAAMLSIQERTIGISRFEEGRMTFPVPVRISLEPVAMTIADINADNRIDCLYVGRNEEDVRFLGICTTDSDGVLVPQGDLFKLEQLQSNPQGIKTADIDQDGLMDVLIFQAYEEPLVVRQTAAGTFESVPRRQSQSGLIKAASLQTLSTTDTNQDGKQELLLSQQNYARALVFDKDAGWGILDQYNAAGREDEIITAAMHDIDNDGTPEVVLLDKKNQQLQILKPADDRTYRVHTTVPIGNWNSTGQMKLFFEDLNGSGRHLVLFDGDKFAFIIPRNLMNRAPALGLKQVFSWETKIRDGRYAHFAVGDVNSDGRQDIVLAEFRKNNLDILAYDVSGETIRILQGTRFKLFEQKSFDSETPMGMAEPRELLIEEVTGDNAADIITLMHDRIVIYPQDF